MKVSCKVWFNNGSMKIFCGFWKNIITDISDYCKQTKLETVKAKWLTET